MSLHVRTRRRRVAAQLGAAALAAGVAIAITNGTGAFAAPSTPASAAGANLSLLDVPIGFSDLDARVGQVAPTAAQQDQVAQLGAVARFTRFGTVGSLIKYGDYLGTGYSGDAVAVARAWLKDNAALFRMTPAEVDSLRPAQRPAHRWWQPGTRCCSASSTARCRPLRTA